jgi:hypothetical protein
LVDDDGSGLTGSVWNKSQLASVLLDPIDVAIARPYCHVWRQAAQPTTTGAWDTLLWDTLIESSPASMWTAGSAWALKVPVAGRYLVSVLCWFASNPTGIRGVRVLNNDAYVSVGWKTTAALPGAHMTPVHFTCVLTMNANATCAAQGYQDSGGFLNHGGGAYPSTSYMQVVKID